MAFLFVKNIFADSEIRTSKNDKLLFMSLTAHLFNKITKLQKASCNI